MWLRCLLFASLGSSLFAAPVELVPPDFKNAAQPQIAVAPAGDIHAVFGQGNAIYHTSSSDGLAFSSPVKIGELENLALGRRRGPRIAVSHDRLLATAISHADGDVHSWTSRDHGRTWQAGPHLNSTAGSAREGLQALAGDGKGHVVAVWLDLRSGGMELWGRTSHDGGETWLPDELIYHSPDGTICQCCVPNAAIASNGKVAVMWRNSLGGSRDLYLATREGDRPFSPAIQLGTGTWKLDACPMDGGNLTISPEGDWLAVWRREKTVFASTGKRPEIPLSADASQPVAAYAGKTPVLLWESNSTLMMKRGDDAPAKFADGTAASIASGMDTAFIVWEGRSAAAQTLLFDRVP